MKRREFLRKAGTGAAGLAAASALPDPLNAGALPETKGLGPRPNILFAFIDDMGYGDPSCYGNPAIETPNMDRLAAEGTRFTQFYANAPVCSPSRVGVTTGRYPARWRINSFLATRERNRRRDMADYLDPGAPSVARTLKREGGYATAHFGKWHMGGGRDVDDAPLPAEYGFDASLVAFEGLGDRLLFEGHELSKASAQLGRGEITWVEKSETTDIYADRTINFIRAHQDEPFYINFWPNDVHDPFDPKPELMETYEDVGCHTYQQQYFAVIAHLDRQIGRVLDALRETGQEDNTLVVLTSDNGPTAWPRYYREGYLPPGRTGGLRGRKWSLYEGGIREPFIVWWPGQVPAGVVNRETVLSGIDLFPTLCSLADVPLPEGVAFDGVDMSKALRGGTPEREPPIFWEYGRKDFYLQPHLHCDRSPNLAVREGRWKLLINADGSARQLYDLRSDREEAHDVAARRPDVASRLTERVMRWRQSLP